MKTKSIILALCGALMSLTASAQFANTSGKGAMSSNSSEGWSSVYVQYNPSTLSSDVDGVGDDNFNGFSLGYSGTCPISQSAPWFVEAGVGLQYLKESTEVDDVKIKVTLFSAKVPVNLLYEFQLPNGKVSILPYAGITLRYNFSGKMKGSLLGSSAELDLFDDGDMGGDAWKRFQCGWQIGTNVKFNNIYAGLSYGSDFSEIWEDCKMSTFSLSLGLCF